jgi:hypothetical protein
MGTHALTDGGTFLALVVVKLKQKTSAAPIPSGKTWNGSIIYSNIVGGQTIAAGTYNGTPSIELDNTSGTQIASGNITTGWLNINNGVILSLI